MENIEEIGWGKKLISLVLKMLSLIEVKSSMKIKLQKPLKEMALKYLSSLILIFSENIDS